MSTWGGTLGSGRHFGSGTMLTCSRDEVVEALRNAETTSELTRILLNARIRSCEV